MIDGLMFSAVDWYRPNMAKDGANAEYQTGTSLVQRSVPVNIQPEASEEIILGDFNQRTMRTTHTVYTTATGFQRDDRLLINGRTLYVLGSRDLISLGRVTALTCEEFTGADPRV